MNGLYQLAVIFICLLDELYVLEADRAEMNNLILSLD